MTMYTIRQATWFAALALLACCASVRAADAAYESPEALVRALYAAHAGDAGPFFQTDDRARVDRWFAKEFADLIWNDTVAAAGEVGTIDADPLFAAQDTEIAELTIHPAKMDGDVDAQVDVTFTNFGEPQKIVYHLQLGNGVWRIVNIGYAEDSLYRRLKDASELP